MACHELGMSDQLAIALVETDVDGLTPSTIYTLSSAVIRSFLHALRKTTPTEQEIAVRLARAADAGLSKNLKIIKDELGRELDLGEQSDARSELDLEFIQNLLGNVTNLCALLQTTQANL